MGLLWRLNKAMNVKSSEQFLAQSQVLAIIIIIF